MKILYILLFMFILCGCEQQSEPILNPPQNLRYEAETKTIFWDVVDEAISYELVINDDTYETTETSYYIDLPSGSYNVKVRAVYDYGLSRYTVSYQVDITRTEYFEINVSDTLDFNPIPGATSYGLMIYNSLNDVIFDDDIESGYDLSSYLGLLRFELKAFYNEAIIASNAFVVDFSGYNHIKEIDDLTITQTSPFDNLYLNDTLMDEANYTYENQIITISSLYLDTLEEGTYLLTIESTINIYLFIEVTSYEKPILLSDSQIDYNNEDIIVTFDLKGGTFDGLASSPTIDVLDYSFTGDTLTIRKAYIEAVLLDNPDRSFVIFSYVLSNGPYTIIGYITVNLK